MSPESPAPRADRLPAQTHLLSVGEFLGRSHYKVFHTTGTAGKLAAAAGVARLLKLDAGRMNHCLGSAGTMAAGLWEFLRDAADSKQLHTAKAAADGLMAAVIARDGFTGAQQIFEGKQPTMLLQWILVFVLPK